MPASRGDSRRFHTCGSRSDHQDMAMCGAGSSLSCSRPRYAFTVQRASWARDTRSTQALQEMQGRMSSCLPSSSFLTQSGSAISPASHRHQIGFALLQYFFRQLDAVNPADRDHGNVDAARILRRIIGKIGGRHEHRRHDVAQSLPVSCGNADRSHTRLYQSLRDLGSLSTVRPPGTYSLPDMRNWMGKSSLQVSRMPRMISQWKAQAPLEVTAVLVVPLV